MDKGEETVAYDASSEGFTARLGEDGGIAGDRALSGMRGGGSVEDESVTGAEGVTARDKSMSSGWDESGGEDERWQVLRWADNPRRAQKIWRQWGQVLRRCCERSWSLIDRSGCLRRRCEAKRDDGTYSPQEKHWISELIGQT